MSNPRVATKIAYCRCGTRVTLQNNQVWIEYDGMEQGIADALIAAGIPSERIVLAFLPESNIALSAM